MQDRLSLLTLYKVLTRLVLWFTDWTEKMLKRPICYFVTLGTGDVVGVSVMYPDVDSSVNDIFLGL